VSTYRPTQQPRNNFNDNTVSTYRPAHNLFNSARTSARNGEYFNTFAIKTKHKNFFSDDEILKQSQSAHFFENKNNGKEYFDDEVVKSTKAPIKQKVRGRQRGRSKFRNVNNANAVTTAPPRTSATVTSAQTRQTFTNTPIVVQASSNNYYDASTTLHATNNHRTFASTAAPQTSTVPQSTTRDETFYDVPKVNTKAQTTKLKSAPVQNYQPQPSSTAAPQVPAGFPFLGAIPQRVIIPSQLSPEQRLALQASNGLQSTASSTPLPSTTANPQLATQFNRVSPNPNLLGQGNDQKSQKEISVLPQKFNFKTQKYESVDTFKPTTQFYNPKYETKGTEQPLISNNNGLSRQTSNKTYAQRQSTTVSSLPTTFNPQQYYQSEQSQYQNLSPRGFSLAAQKQTQPPKSTQPEVRPQPQITSRSEQARTHKKFSTLVPKDQYNPTTFKPNNGFTKKPVDQFAQKIQKVQNPDNFYSQQYTSVQTTPSTTTVYTTPYTQFYTPSTTRLSNFFSSTSTARPLAAGEEDDGLYRPELYEKDFYRNKAKTTRITPAPVRNNFNNFYQTSSTTFKPQNNFNNNNNLNTNNNFNNNLNNNNFNNNNNNSGEDELFKTAHSQNIFASGNALRAEKEREKVVKFDYSTTITEKSSPRPFSKPTQPATPSPPKSTVKTTTKPRREKIEKDVSYDYQYYDTNADGNDYSELEAIEEFGKTAKKIKKN
jgi:hypothetical protein